MSYECHTLDFTVDPRFAKHEYHGVMQPERVQIIFSIRDDARMEDWWVNNVPDNVLWVVDWSNELRGEIAKAVNEEAKQYFKKIKQVA